METIAHTPRLPFPAFPGRNTVRSHGSSSTRISSQQQQRATMPGTKVAASSLNIFQRALLWIKGWVQSRVKVWSLNRALSPFIEAAKADKASEITKDHFKKLASALEDWTTPHAASLVAEVVRDNVKSLDLAGLKRLKTQLDRLAPAGTQCRKTLLETVDGRIKDAKVAEAQQYLSDALNLFSEWSAKPFDADSEADISLSQLRHKLLAIADLVRPAGNMPAVDDAEQPQKIEFESASSVITEQVLRTWFRAHSPTQLLRVKANLWSIAQDSAWAQSASKPEQAMHAFCRTVTTLLWPDDKRHATRYN